MISITTAVEAVRARERRRPEVALVLGSGLGELAAAVEDACVIPSSDIPGYPRSSVQGHSGRLVVGRLEGRDVVFVQGRVHLYEGHPIEAVTFPIRLVHALGARRLVVTNAAGGINPLFRPGTLMFITDHINLSFTGPLVGRDLLGSNRFTDLSDAFDPVWTDAAEQVALREGIDTRRGVYLWTRGPSYESPAEIRMFGRLGADAVGMSTVPEVIEARHLGLSVLGISTITNPAAGLSSERLAHGDVLDVGRRVRGELERLIRGILRDT